MLAQELNLSPVSAGHGRMLAGAAVAMVAAALVGCGTAPPAGVPATPGSSPSAAAEGPTLAQARAALPPESPECLSPKIRKPEPLPASAIPEPVLRQARSGFTVLRYDLVAGRVSNLTVAASHPAGLYDPYALAHAARYADSSKANAKGCYMTVEIKF